MDNDTSAASRRTPLEALSSHSTSQLTRSATSITPIVEKDGQSEEDDKANEVKFQEGDPANPKNWSVRRRISLTMLCSLLTITVTFASSASTSSVQLLSQDFGISLVVSQFITTLFLLGYVFGPFVWAPASELFGRRWVFLIAFALFLLFSMANALACNVTTLFVCRFLSGFFAAAPLSNCGGVINDLYTPVGRGPAMSIFVASVFAGPSLGPLVGGWIVVGSMRWDLHFWVQVALAGICLILVAVFLPETFAPMVLKQKAQRLRKEQPEKYAKAWAPLERRDNSPKALLQQTIVKPFRILSMEPILMVTTLYLSLVYAILYATFQVYPLIWQLRGFNLGEIGLIFLGTLLGTTLGAALNIYFSRGYHDLTRKWKGFPPPEERLWGAMATGPLLVVGLFWLGWTGAYASVPWYVPLLPTILLGASFSLVFISLLSYLVDVYLLHAASALAANTILRSALAAAFPLFTRQMYMNMGIQWASTLLGCIALVLAPSPYLFYRYGPRIRSRSQFAPNVDLKLRPQVLDEENRAE